MYCQWSAWVEQEHNPASLLQAAAREAAQAAASTALAAQQGWDREKGDLQKVVNMKFEGQPTFNFSSSCGADAQNALDRPLCKVAVTNTGCTHLLQALNAARAEASSSTAAARQADAECDRMAADAEAAVAARDSSEAALADAQADQVLSLTTMQAKALLAAAGSSHWSSMHGSCIKSPTAFLTQITGVAMYVK